jgi:PAX-interacting protein 1
LNGQPTTAGAPNRATINKNKAKGGHLHLGVSSSGQAATTSSTSSTNTATGGHLHLGASSKGKTKIASEANTTNTSRGGHLHLGASTKGKTTTTSAENSANKAAGGHLHLGVSTKGKTATASAVNSANTANTAAGGHLHLGVSTKGKTTTTSNDSATNTGKGGHLHLGVSVEGKTTIASKANTTNTSKGGHLCLGVSTKGETATTSAASSTNTDKGGHLHLGVSVEGKTTTASETNSANTATGGHLHLGASAEEHTTTLLTSPVPSTPEKAISEETLTLFEENQYSPRTAHRMVFQNNKNQEMSNDNETTQRMAEIIHTENRERMEKLMRDNGWDQKYVNKLMADNNKARRREEKEDEEAALTPQPQQPRPKWADTSNNTKNKKKLKKNTQKTTHKTTEKTNENKTQKEVEPVVPKKPPSIMAKKIKPKEFSAALAEKGVAVNYKKAGDKIAIKCSSSKDHTTVMELLRTEELGGHSYTPKDLRKAVMLMKDIHYSIPIEDVKAAIKEQSGLEVEAKRLETPRSKNKGYTLDIVMVTTEEKNVNELIKTRHVENMIVKWSRMEKRDITQCYRCQQFGHVALNCLNKYRCVKCKEDHGPKECKRTPNDKPEDAFCTNCQKKGHPASFRGCPKALEILNKVNKNKIAKDMTREQKAHIEAVVNSYVGDETYAQMVIGQPAQQRTQRPPPGPQHPEPTAGFLGEECTKHFGMNLFEVLRRARAFIPRYKRLTTENEQQVALLDFIFTLC